MKSKTESKEGVERGEEERPDRNTWEYRERERERRWRESWGSEQCLFIPLAPAPGW